MYVISIKRVKTYYGCVTLGPDWRYACYDRFCGSLSTGDPTFADLSHAIFFSSPKAAKEWFDENKRFIDFSFYDKKSLAIRKVSFKTIEKLRA